MLMKGKNWPRVRGRSLSPSVDVFLISNTSLLVGKMSILLSFQVSLQLGSMSSVGVTVIWVLREDNRSRILGEALSPSMDLLFMSNTSLLVSKVCILLSF